MSFCGMYSILFDCSNIHSCHEPRKEMGALACRKSNSQTSRTTCLKKKTSQNYYSCNNSMLQLHFSASFTIKLLITQKSWRHYFEIGCFCHAFFPSFGNVDLRWLHSVALFRTSISVNNICGWRCCHLWWEGYLPSPGLNSNLTGSSRCGFGHRQLKCCFSGPGLTTYISLDSRLFLSIS